LRNIVYILPDTYAGVASVVRNLTRFKSDRYVVKVILLHNLLNYNKRRIKDEFLADEMVRITYHPKWDSAYRVYLKLKKYIDKHSVIVPNCGEIDLLAISFIRFKIPVCYLMHGDYKHYYNVLNEKFKNISSIITVSDFLYHKISKLTQLESIKISSLKFPVPSIDMQEKLFLDKTKIKLIFIGSLLKAKGIYHFKEILEDLEIKNINYEFTIVGSGVEEFRLREELNIYKKVLFLGDKENKEVLKLLQKQDVILLPSEREGLPVVIVEAMKSGVVPITTNLQSGIPELIDHDVNGFTVGLNNVGEMSNFIEVLYNDFELLKTMSAFCVKKANKMFDPNKQTYLYENFIVNTKPKQQQCLSKYKWFQYLPFSIVYRLKNKI